MSSDRRQFLQRIAAGVTSGFARPGVAVGQEPRRGAAALPRVPYGAVYFRKSNPPREDWERDYKQAASDGLNAFRHWFLWSAIAVTPETFDWEDYDQQLDLAAKYGIKTIVADILATAPQWAFQKHPRAWVEAADGTRAASHYTVACAVGGWPGLCLDNEDVRAHAERFLQALARRYRNHPAMGGYDVWNELNHLGDAGGCYCEASAKKFREWLQRKYGDLDVLNKAWYRYSYTSWEDVQIPRTNDPYPDSIDWALFRVDNAVRLLKWRIETIKSVDPRNPVTAHAIPIGVLDRVGPKTYPVFQAGQLVDIYGYTGGGAHDESSRLRWKHWCDMDLIRSAAKGKPYWAAEMAAGAQWRWRSGRKMHEGRVGTASDIRLYTMIHFAGGTRGVFSPRWRPLQDGPYMGSFAFYAMDGSPTERSRAAGEMARWANADEQSDVFEARPVEGDIGILVVPESQIHCYASEDSTDFYYRAIRGAYQGFLFNNIQVDFVHAGEIGATGHDVLYLPYPVMLTEATARKLKEWVRGGGRLISEGCPAYFGDRGRAGTRQPHYGLDEMFGVREAHVQFTPDLLEDLRFAMTDGYRVRGGVFLQAYEPTTGVPVAEYDDGRIAAVDNHFGKGRTRLIGTFPGYGYSQSPDEPTRRFFAETLRWAQKEQHVRSGGSGIVARLQTSAESGAAFLWIVNSVREDVRAELVVGQRWGPFRELAAVWGKAPQLRDGRKITLTAPARDVVVVRLTS